MVAKIDTFRKFLLDHEDLASSKLYVPFKNNLHFLRENISLPYMRFLYKKSLFKNVFDHNLFYLSTDFKNFCCTFCDKLNVQLCQENILDKFKQLQNICEKPLSHTRKYTLVNS